MDSYRVSLNIFEGPLDLLLHLIKKEELNIYDIPIAHLLDQYIQYIGLAQELNIDLAGEFLEMAAELTYLKSRNLIPDPEIEEDEGPDPREDLVRRLLEYQRYKEVAQELIKRPLLGHDVFRRPPTEISEEGLWIEADMVSLLAAFQGLLKKLPADRVHEIRQVRMGVAERIIGLVEKIQGRERVSFEELFEGDTQKQEIVVTFLAILEMARQGLLRLLQERVFNRIYIHPRLSSEAPVFGAKEDELVGGIHGTQIDS